jgi:hypothetical protein
LLVIALLIVGAPPAAEAQKANRVEKVKKKLRAMRAALLVDELDLDEKTATKLMPILNDYDDDFAKLAKENAELRAKIEAAGDDDDLDALIDDLVENQRARWDLDEKRFKEVRKVLTPKQSAKILVILPEIDRKILEGVKRAIDKQGKAGAGGKRKKGRKHRGDGTVKDPFMEP